jgi:hypothetical protein
MKDIWEEVWGIIDETFHRIAVSLSAGHPKMSWSSGHNDNKAFPFRAYATFNEGPQGAEDVVSSVDFHRSENKLRYSADIGHDDGTVLADGPTGIIDVSEGVLSARDDIEAAVGGIARFLEASEKVVSNAMNRRRQ